MKQKKYIRGLTESGHWYEVTAELWNAYRESVGVDVVLTEQLETDADADFYYDPNVTKKDNDMKTRPTIYIAAEPKRVEKFVTEDGTEFDTREEALEHEFYTDLAQQYNIFDSYHSVVGEYAALGREFADWIKANESMIRVALGDRDET